MVVFFSMDNPYSAYELMGGGGSAKIVLNRTRGEGGSAKIACTFLGTKGPLEYNLFSPKKIPAFY